MLAVRGYYDGSCVRILEPLDIKKNQNVIIHIEETKPMEEHKLEKSNDAFLAALEDDSLVMETGLDVEAYMKEMRDGDRF